ncbi:hypothetical protein HK101_006212 [Irineochytrium annulatum]|nr:hypothetical protein HK101_006212 [Irineochytrium annulatum]
MTSNSRVFICAGYGVGISSAVAKKFGALGFHLALLSRTESKGTEAASALRKDGVKATGYAVDLADPPAVVATVEQIRQDLGSIHVLFWNTGGSGRPYSALDCPIADFHREFNACNVSFASAVRVARSDLIANKGAVLNTGSGIGVEKDVYTTMAVERNTANMALAKAAQRKLVHILHETLKPDGIYVGECTVLGPVRGTAADHAQANIKPDMVADVLRELYTKRTVCFSQIE